MGKHANRTQQQKLGHVVSIYYIPIVFSALKCDGLGGKKLHGSCSFVLLHIFEFPHFSSSQC